MLLNVITEQFNNREIATGSWMLIVFVFSLCYKPTRELFPPLISVFLDRKILIIFLCLATYVCLITSSIAWAGIWDVSNHLKATAIWTITVAFAMIVNISDATKEDNFFRKVLIDTIKLTIIVEFIIGLYPFNLLVEFLLIPVLVFIVGMVTVAGMKQEYLPVKKFFEWLLAIVGFVLLWHSIQYLFADPSSLFSIEGLIDLILSSLLTILLLPFIYFFALFIEYENVFMQLKNRNQNSPLLGYAKQKIFFHFGLNLNKLTRWSKQHPNLKVNSKAEILELISK